MEKCRLPASSYGHAQRVVQRAGPLSSTAIRNRTAYAPLSNNNFFYSIISNVWKIHRKNRVGGSENGWHIVPMNDYDRIATVIRYIEEHRQEQPHLDMLADLVGLSSSYFHRLFSDWAGITPKNFMQCLTMSDARSRLLKGNSVLEAALESGLSGPGRLHDLCLNLESATPGDIKAGGAGWTIRAGVAETPFGSCLIAESLRGICHLSFFQPSEESSNPWKTLEAQWPNAEFTRNDEWAGVFCKKVFQQRRTHASKSSLKLFVKGSAFQVKVWRALMQIPDGALVSYSQLAKLVGNPKASRAVGTAVGHNSIGFLIPCHRVIRESGAIGGYAWGADRKRAIQVWENQPGG